MTPPIIHRPDEADSYAFREGCDILEPWNRSDDPALSIARATVPVGVTTRVHWLERTTERYLILSGQGLARIGELPETQVQPGDVIHIPPGCPQSIQNTGSVPLVFLAICTPRFEPAVYHQCDD
ncbi:cupin domain-containing protein [Thiorhodovibrio frisius]|uniref:Mannose-6-phosphate isomerase n=1 Tax=Thiorhodovibrio frisius TaxID=631362 RepID=H8Z7M0_9GAMM|nr:cupin domain-containing protein [Thiorhodovibrio frisius]EIC19873.1 mannose-6-phosphate isomerase [Thiorhodovibrio frisius]WPL20601.1 hypothetical protein Thiofri_00700 [Thiorhodovibrio frisius]